MATEPDGFVALRGAFDRFYRTLDATTVPADAGGRMVDGVAHAVALSEATDALYVELAAASRRLFKQHGRAIAECPPGVVLLESDSPDGPWTPIPTDAIAAATMGIGGDGADAVLMAALESATKAASFPIDKWNAMQAARPGANHQRFHAGEVVSAKDLAVLESASKLLRLMVPRATPVVRAGNDAYQPVGWFKKGMAGRLRKAASATGRKTKRVRTQKIDGVIFYSVADARRWWPNDVPPKEA
jgi:hypothetical protein